MKATKIGLLLLILAFGSTVETAWRVRNNLAFGPAGCRVLGGRFYGPSFSFQEERTEPLPAAAALEVENAFGNVNVVAGLPGQVKLTVRKVVYAATEAEAREFAAKILVRADRDAGTLRFGTNRRELEDAIATSRTGFETHLDLAVPADAKVKVVNSHGEVALEDVAAAEIASSFDDIRVERVAGPVDVQGRHGAVVVSTAAGPVTVTNRYGDTKVEDAPGVVRLDVQHGEVTVNRVGPLTVAGAFGDVTIDGVRGDLEVRAQHAGVEASNVTGKADVATSFRDVSLDHVGGDALARTEHGAIAATDVTGALDAQASFDSVTATRVAGPVHIVVVHGGVRGDGLAKGAYVKGSGDDIVLQGFQGPMEVEAERAGVRLVPAGAIVDSVKVTTRHGGIELEVPAGSRFELRASAERGEVSADVPGITTTVAGGSRLEGRVGAGGAEVLLAATYGDVSVRSAAAVASSSSAPSSAPPSSAPSHD